MKLTLILLTATLCAAASESASQSITFSAKKASPEEIILAVKQQSKYVFFYDEKIFKDAKKISITANEMPVKEFLSIAFRGQPFTWSIQNRTIILKELPAVVPSDRELTRLDDISDQNKLPITGKVIDSTGTPLVGASISIRGKSRSAMTDGEGKFTITAEPGDVLVISFVGYESQTYRVTKETNATIFKLVASDFTLGEVEVVFSTGYQEIPKDRATGSFVYVDNKTLSRTVSTGILDRLAYVTSSLRKGFNGGLGDGKQTDISIRGISTIQASQRPLIVVDGFPYEEQEQDFKSILLNNLNPNDVESITILRDAAAASIWGARSANGVIVITTKSGGFNQATNVQLNSNINIKERPDLFRADIMSSKDVIEFEKNRFDAGVYNDYDDLYPSMNYFPVLSPAVEIMLAQRRGDLTAEQANAQLTKLENHDVRNDILKYLIRPAFNQQYNLSVSGGGNKMSYYGSVGFDKNLGTNIGNDDSRLTLNFKNNYRPLKNLELTTYINYSQGKTRLITVDPLMQYLPVGYSNGNPTAPYLQIVDEQGIPLNVPFSNGGFRTAYIDTVSTPGLLDWHYNPIDEINNSDNVARNFTARFGGSLKYTIIPGITIDLGGQYERSMINNDNYQSLKSYAVRNAINMFMYLDGSGKPQYPVPLGGILDATNSTQTTYNLRGKINVNKTFGKHNISAIAGVDASQNDYLSMMNRVYGYDPGKLLYASNVDFVTVYSKRPDLSGSKINDLKSIFGSINRFLSYYTSMGYSFMNKYTLTASARVDGSNYFGVKANQRFTPLWSVGAGWYISKEDFFQSNVISTLKLRATYGYNGNLDNKIPTMPTISYTAGSSSLLNTLYNNAQSYATVIMGNPSLTWEKVGTTNLGINFGVFNDRVTGSLEYYTKKVINLIGSRPADPTIGQLEYQGNTAGLKARGIDLQLNALVIDRAIKVQTAFSISYNTDEITAYYLSGNFLQNYSTYLADGYPIVGKPLNRLYSFKWAGLDETNGNPMGIVNGQRVSFTEVLANDANFKPNTRPEDLVYHGRSTPSVFGNMLNTISYKNFSFSFNCVYNLGFYFRRPSIDYNKIQDFWSGHGDYARRWQKPGDELITYVPSFSLDARYSFYSNSEVLVEKADHISLQDANVSYQLDKTRLRNLPFKSVQIFINAKNLGILWRANKKGIDPRAGINNIPIPREIAIGLNINF